MKRLIDEISACIMSWIKPAFGEDGSSDASAAKTSKISNISKTETEPLSYIKIFTLNG